MFGWPEHLDFFLLAEAEAQASRVKLTKGFAHCFTLTSSVDQQSKVSETDRGFASGWSAINDAPFRERNRYLSIQSAPSVALRLGIILPITLPEQYH